MLYSCWPPSSQGIFPRSRQPVKIGHPDTHHDPSYFLHDFLKVAFLDIPLVLHSVYLRVYAKYHFLSTSSRKTLIIIQLDSSSLLALTIDSTYVDSQVINVPFFHAKLNYCWRMFRRCLIVARLASMNRSTQLERQICSFLSSWPDLIVLVMHFFQQMAVSSWDSVPAI